MEKSFTLKQLADTLQAQYRGDPEYAITGLATLAKASSKDISFFANARYRAELPHTKAGIVIIASEHLKDCPSHALLTKDPYLAFAKIAHLFAPSSSKAPTIHPTAVVDPSAELDPTVTVGAYTVIGANVTVGRRTHLFPHVTIYDNVNIGKEVTIHSGTVIGSDGFGYAKDPTPDGKYRWFHVPQLGGVQIGDNVEIGANTTIDCGTLEDTIIEEGVILDNQIQIAHNVHIGAHTAIAGCAVIAGSTKIGKFCAIGGGSIISGHIELADYVNIIGGTAVASSIREPGVYGGPILAHPFSTWKRNALAFQKLAKLKTR